MPWVLKLWSDYSEDLKSSHSGKDWLERACNPSGLKYCYILHSSLAVSPWISSFWVKLLQGEESWPCVSTDVCVKPLFCILVILVVWRTTFPPQMTNNIYFRKVNLGSKYYLKCINYGFYCNPSIQCITICWINAKNQIKLMKINTHKLALNSNWKISALNVNTWELTILKEILFF